eukprot:Plantae.Rhodophyta-Purpureofilum_apyrenoidigerum.ctg46305.p1 GENE.Plantae.Rhodophyta-Purpureofilum_apyrenoidigerum.ctg46305~~Plantae.Rhodophyta-Purpureofilum_apyrenoidigerum.ctg46305.p1  ORF type:complete len:117 (+),score=3.33 Plantae.Rhodophyta-Purpureofilum_apyrenoidigerum.ctg46305:251-601(+)
MGFWWISFFLPKPGLWLGQLAIQSQNLQLPHWLILPFGIKSLCEMPRKLENPFISIALYPNHPSTAKTHMSDLLTKRQNPPSKQAGGISFKLHILATNMTDQDQKKHLYTVLQAFE